MRFYIAQINFRTGLLLSHHLIDGVEEYIALLCDTLLQSIKAHYCVVHDVCGPDKLRVLWKWLQCGVGYVRRG